MPFGHARLFKIMRVLRAIALQTVRSRLTHCLILMSILRVAKRIQSLVEIFPLSFDFDTTDAKIAKKLNLWNRKAVPNADKKMRMGKSYLFDLNFL